MTFSTGSALPQKYNHGAFVGERGSWNRDSFNGYRVDYIPFDNGRPLGVAQNVVNGFLDGNQTHGRPVGLAIDGTGALLIADDAGNSVWRVAASDGSVTAEAVGSDPVDTSETTAAIPQPGAAHARKHLFLSSEACPDTDCAGDASTIGGERPRVREQSFV